MSKQKIRLELQELRLTAPIPLTSHPVAVYLDNLAESSRRTMGEALNAIARLLTNGECDAYTLDWSKLRYQHTAAIRSSLQQGAVALDDERCGVEDYPAQGAKSWGGVFLAP